MDMEVPAVTGSGDAPGWVGVVSIVLGVLGIACWGGQGVMAEVGRATMETFEQSPGHRAFEAGGYIAGTVLGLLLLVGGIGVLSRAAWGGGVLRLWAWLRLLVMVIGLIGAFYWLDEVVAAARISMEQEAAAGPGTTVAADEEFVLPDAALRGFAIGWLVVVNAAACIWPIIVLVLCRKRRS